MAQQINLYSPILLSTKRYLSAVAMAQGLAAIAIGAAALCIWTTFQTRELRRDLLQTERNLASEKQQLTAAIALSPSLNTNTTALEQNLKALGQTLAQRQLTLDELTRGTVREGHSHSAMLRLVASTVPAPVWLTDVSLATGKLEISGLTLDPAALRPWIARLSADPQLAGRQLATVHVERTNPPTAGATPTSTAQALGNRLEAWSFTLSSSTEAPAAKEVALTGNTPTAEAYLKAAIARAAAAASANAPAIPGAKP